MRHRLLALLLATAATSAGAQGVDLTGAGATFPYPIYSKWFATYAQKAGVKINYQSIGSGGGIRQLSEETVDFGATDGPMTDDEMGKAKGGRIMHVPTVIGAVALAYNLPGISEPIKLDAGVIADMFLGKIRKWNDGKIAKLNPGVSLPDKSVLVVHRSDGSGTTYIFTDYLASTNKEWLAGPGRGKDVQWPVGLGGKGNEGVAGQVRQLPGAIGYVELAYAKQNKLAYAAVKNAAGEFVLPSVEAATAAAEGVVAKLSPKSDYRLSIVNAQGKSAYPISSFTWIILYQNQADGDKGKKLVDFLKWALTEGQAQVASLDYAPLPSAMAQRLVERLGTVRVNGVATR
jgi:phosphate transport system substrate-binding protein